MAHNVSNEYKQIIYSGDARNKLKILFNNVELENADRYCERMTVKSRIIANGSKVFSLNNFISKEIELVLHDINTSIIQNQVSISIGTLVGNSYEYVPIGIFNIQDTPTNDKNKTIIKLRDNSVKFDFNYNAQPLIDENGGSATKLQILQDICTQAGVTCNITSFIGYLDEIGVYDNTITARQYIANIAEQAGKIATINRNGELIFIDLNNLTTWEIPIDIVEKYENGTSFKIGQVVYEDGIVRYETPTSNDDTLFLDGSNNYINGELIKEQASSNNNTYDLTNTGNSDLAYLELEGKTTQETRSGRNLFNYKDTSSVTSGVTTDNEGWITVTYDNTSGTANKYMNYWTNNLALNTSTNYNIITEVKSVSGSGSLIVASNPNANSGQFQGSIGYSFGSLSNNAVKVETKTTKTSFTNVTDGLRTYIQFQTGQSGSITFRISVLADTSITPSTFVYEAYGVSPSINYPSELVSVGYQNLLNGASKEWSEWVTPGYNLNNRSFYYYFTTENMEKFTKGQVMTFSYDVEFDNVTGTSGQTMLFVPQIVINETLDNMYNGQWFTFASESNVYYTLLNGVYHFEHTFTLNADRTNYVRYGFVPRVDYWASGKFRIRNAQLQVGDKAGKFIEYGKYGINVIMTSSNEFDLNEIDYCIKNYVSTSSIDNGIRVTNTYNNYQNTFAVIDLGLLSKRAGQKYTLSFNATASGSNNIRAYLGTSDNAGGNRSVISNLYASGSVTITVPSPDNTHKKLILALYGNSSSSTAPTGSYIDYTNIQFEKGNVATEYQEHSNKQLFVLNEPLRSIGNIKDLLYIKNGMLNIIRNIGIKTLNSTETWYKGNDDGGFPRYYTVIPEAYFHNDTLRHSDKIKSNYFIATITASPQSVYQYRDQMIFDTPTTLNTLQLFKTWLSTNNVEIQYVLNQPYVEELGTIEMPKTYNLLSKLDIVSAQKTNSYIQYRKDETQLEAILNEVNLFDIDSLKTGKILGNPAIDPYDLIQIHDKSKNLFDLDTYLDNTPLGNCTIEKIKNGFIMNFTPGVDAMVGATLNSGATLPVNYRNGVIKVEPNTTYTISLNASPKAYISYFNENYVATQNYTKLPILYTPSKYTFTTNATTRYLFLRLGIQDSNYSSWIYQDVQVEKGNTATSYISFKDETYITLATNDLTYTGIMINTFDTQIEEEAKEQNVFVNGEATFQKWARTKIDNVEGSITLQAGEINEANGRINETNLRIDKDGALLNVLANNSNIDVEYDSQGNPLSGEVREVTTTTGFTFNAEGMTIQDTSSNFRALHRNDGTYYYDGTTIVGQYTKDGSKQKDLDLFGIYTYGKNNINETPMFIAQLFTDGNGEEGFGHFYNRGD